MIDYQGGNVIVIQYQGEQQINDTIHVNEDGCFNVEIPVKQSNIGYLYYDKINASRRLLLEDGIRMELMIQQGKRTVLGQDLPTLEIICHGDNEDVFLFEEGYNYVDLMEQWNSKKLLETSFRDYRYEIDKFFDTFLCKLYQINSLSYRMLKSGDIENNRFDILYRWATIEDNIKKHDADFERWILSFDHNDISQIKKTKKFLYWCVADKLPSADMQNSPAYFRLLNSIFHNQELKNFFADNKIKAALKEAPDNMDELLSAYKACSTNPEGHAVADKLYAHYSKLKKGAPAADFDFYDKKGKRYTLKDLRGKAVYIDCWATWCGPCCAEIPYMEKLYAHYKNNKKVELISISLDDSKSKWEKKINEDKPGWRQFIVNDNFKSKLCQNYDIDAIPRFLMFDKKGNIISLDAPRPSGENIIQWIDSNL